MKYFQTLTVIGIFYYYSCVLAFSPLAPSPFSVTVPEFSGSSQSGQWGTYLIGAAIYYLGAGAFVLPVIPLILTALSTAYRAIHFKPWKIIASSLLLSVAASQILEMVLPIFFFKGYPISTAGSVGSFINSLTTHYLGKFGVLSIIILCLTLAIIVISTESFSFLNFLSAQNREQESREEQPTNEL